MNQITGFLDGEITCHVLQVTTISVSLQAAASMAQMMRMRRLFGITKGDY